MGGFILILILGSILGGIIYKDWYDSTDHVSCSDQNALRPEARIIDVQREQVGTKGHRRWRTTVSFDDGFQYISHETQVEEFIFSYKISVTDKQNEEILIKAVVAHQKAIEEKE